MPPAEPHEHLSTVDEKEPHPRYLDKSVTWDTTSKLTNNNDIVMIRRGAQR